MIDIKLLRENPELVKEKLAAKKVPAALIDDLVKIDEKWRRLTTEIDSLRAQQKELSVKMKINQAKTIKKKIKALEEDLAKSTESRRAILERLPNLPQDNVSHGKSGMNNAVIREVGRKTKTKFTPKDYLELAEKLDIIDVQRAAKVSGSRFSYLKKEGALLELALINFAFSHLVKAGFIPVIPPVMIKPDVFRGMGRLTADQEEERYYLPKDDLYLVGSSEHSIGSMHKDEIFSEKDLPIRYAGFSTCFRREAGSYGKDTKGILRVHQFDKVEMFVFCRPEDSEKELMKLVAMQEKLVKALKLPYRVVEVCAGDMGWTDARQFDIETWLPAQGTYRETHSASNTTDFQARGVNVRFRRASNSGQPEFVYMLNATALAIGRTIIAIIENYQTEKGTIKVPVVLQKYCGFKEIK